MRSFTGAIVLAACMLSAGVSGAPVKPAVAVFIQVPGSDAQSYVVNDTNVAITVEGAFTREELVAAPFDDEDEPCDSFDADPDAEVDAEFAVAEAVDDLNMTDDTTDAGADRLAFDPDRYKALGDKV